MRLTFTAFISLLFISFQALAQREEPSNPLEVGYSSIDEVGIFVGAGPDFMTGKFFPSCPECYFDNGKGTAFTVGALYETRGETSQTFSWGGSVGYTTRSVEASFRERENVFLPVEGQDDSINIGLPFRHIGQANFSFLMLQPYAKWTPVKWIFLRVGAGASFMLDATIKHDKEIVEKIVSLPNGQKAVYTFLDGSTTTTLEEGKFPNASSFQFSLEPAIGANIFLSRKFTLSPVVQYSFPLMNLSSRGEDFRIHALQFFAELRMRL